MTEAEQIIPGATIYHFGILTSNVHMAWIRTVCGRYDEVLMPPELRKAHQANDRAVMEAYGLWGHLNTESECVAELMKMYQQLATHK